MREMKRLSSYMHACEWFSALWRSRFTRHSSPANRRKFYLVVFFYYSIASSRARVPWFLWQHRAISRIYANTVQMRVSMAATRPTIGNLHENYATFAVFVGYWDLMCDKHCCWLALRAQPTIAPRQNWVCPIVIVIYLFCCFFVVIVVLSTKLSTDNDQTEFPFQVTSTQWNISKTHTEKTKKKTKRETKYWSKWWRPACNHWNSPIACWTVPNSARIWINMRRSWRKPVSRSNGLSKRSRIYWPLPKVSTRTHYQWNI